MHGGAFCFPNSLFAHCKLSADEDNLPRRANARFGAGTVTVALSGYFPTTSRHDSLPRMDGNPACMGNHPWGDPCGQFKRGQELAQPAAAFKQPDRKALLEHGDGEQTMGESGHQPGIKTP